MVIIALPLHLHAPAAIEAMEKGKHVLCEKLMAKTVGDCKRMARAAAQDREAAGDRPPASLQLPLRERAGGCRPRRTFSATCGTSARSGIATRPRAAGRAPKRATTIPGSRKCRPRTSDVDSAKYGYKSMEELVRWRLQPPTGRGLDGGTRQPPAGRVRHPAESGARRQTAARRASAGRLGSRRELVLHGRTRGGGPHVPHLRISRATSW